MAKIAKSAFSQIDGKEAMSSGRRMLRPSG
jgi:hypothetical protein